MIDAKRPVTVPFRRDKEMAAVGFLCVWGLALLPFWFVAITQFHKVPLMMLVMIGLFSVPAVVGIPLGISRRRRNVAILRDGRMTSAEIVGVQSTGVKINSQPQFEVEVRYDAGGERRLKKLKVYGAHGDLARDTMESGRETPLLVDPNDPDHCVLGIQLTNPYRVRL